MRLIVSILLRTPAGSSVAPALRSGICIAKDPAIQRSYPGGVEARKLDQDRGERWRVFSNAETNPVLPGSRNVAMWKPGRPIALVLGFDEHLLPSSPSSSCSRKR